MNYRVLEILSWIVGGFSIILQLFFLAAFPRKIYVSTKRMILPPIALTLYVLYELYFTLPEVVMSLPLRIDLVILIPLHWFSFFLWCKVFDDKEEKGEKVFSKQGSYWVKAIFMIFFLIF